MLENRPDDRARYRFAADMLPVTRRPIVVMQPAEGSDGLALTDGATIFMSLDDEASMVDARELAERLNERVRRLGYVSAQA